MKNLNIYSLAGKVEISFIPTDSAFVERLFNTFDTLDKKQDAYKAESEAVKSKREIFDIDRKWDLEMCGMIDAALGQPVCDAVFGQINVFALADGLPVWANLLLPIMEEIDTPFTREQKATNPR